MHPTHQNQKPSSATDLQVIFAVVILLLVVVVSRGIVQMQRGVDMMYLPYGSNAFQAGVTADSPQIIVVGNPAHGKQLFNMSCFVCHGPTGSGVPTLGANLRQSKFIHTRSDQQLITFIKMGRQPGDPNTVFNGTMPPRGGNPMLDDTGLQDVVAFLRTLQAAELGGFPDPSRSTASTLR